MFENADDRPTLVAHYRSQAPTVDGVIMASEYGQGVDVNFTADSRFGAIGFGDGPNRTRAPDDLSVRLHAAYSDRALFLAVRVRDQFVDTREADHEHPHLNDCVELFVDGDRVANDFAPNRSGSPGTSSREGFQLLTDAQGHRVTVSDDFTSAEWNAATKHTSDGYVVEFEIPLELIDVQDGPRNVAAGGGSLINFTMGLDDFDSVETRPRTFAYLRARPDVGQPYRR